MTEILGHGYSSESTQQEPSNKYQHDRVKMDLKNLCVLVLWMKVISASEELNSGYSHEAYPNGRHHNLLFCIV